jgi:hypothetical protein
MVKLLVNPTLETVNAELRRMCELANAGHANRLAALDVLPAEWRHPEFHMASSGHGVATRHAHAADLPVPHRTCTVAGYAWLTDPATRTRYVLIHVARMTAPRSLRGDRSAYPFGYGTAAVRWAKATPSEVFRGALLAAQVMAELTPAIRAAFFAAPGGGAHVTWDDAAGIGAAADWLDEHGHPTEHVRAYLAALALCPPKRRRNPAAAA